MGEESLNDRLKRQAAEGNESTAPIEPSVVADVKPAMPINDADPVKRKYMIAIAALALVVAFLGYRVANQSGTIAEQVESIGVLGGERAQLEFDLEKMRFSYDTLAIENGMMMAEMAAQRSEIDKLISKVRDRNYKVSRLTKEAGTLRRIMQGYVVTIDSLNQLNLALVEENTAMQAEVASVKKRNDDLEQRQGDMEELIEAGQVLQAMDIVPLAIRIAANGAQRPTTRAARTEMIKTCFTLMESRITKPGERELSLEVVSPDSLTVSVSRTVDYSGERLDACVFFSFDEGVIPEKGTYTVHLIDQGVRISSADLILR